MTAVPAVPTPRGQVRERPGRELVPAQFGLLDPLTDIAHGYYLDGFSDDAVTACRMWAVLADAVDDVVTSRYLLYIQAVALLELGRYGDAVDVAAQLIDSLDGADEPVWRAKALAATAEASTRLARPSAAIAALAEADWLVRSVPSGTYGHLSASMALALALRSANLVERSDEVLSRLDGLGDALVEVLIVQELALLSAHWATVLSLIGRREEARRHYADTARRALRMQACARLADSPSMVARGEVIEAFAMLHLGDTELAAARARGAAGRFDARPELMESHLLLLVLGTSAARGGDLLGARLHLRALVRDAEGCGREVWAMAGRAALADVDTLQHGEAEGTVLWREVAQTALASVWAEREARFAALRDQDSIRDLTERADRYGRDILEDPLTGLGNRRMLTRALKGQVGDSVIFVDVDEFKAVNDTFSHAVGDTVLQVLGQILREQSRQDDLLIRYGGDEFVMLPAGNAEAAVTVAGRVRAAVIAHPWDEVAPGLEVTVSIGIGHGGAAAELLHSADRALLAAKRMGRNRVVEAG